MKMVEYIQELAPALNKLPFDFVYQLTVCTRDAVGGYGWHHHLFVKVWAVGKECRRCGYSDIIGGENKCNRHSWEHQELTVMFEDIYSDETLSNCISQIKGMTEKLNKASYIERQFLIRNRFKD
jgi:hypothetical protein